ncbi:MAG: hypothetical protein KDA24_08610 [Deltaproteobacteria bacterium]|nr:hypothetical protein [Deltaproteobacteria bacterium]
MTRPSGPLLALVLALAGCPSGAVDDDDAVDVDDVVDDDDVGDDDDATPPEGCVSVSGTVTVPDGISTPDQLRVDLCSGECRTETPEPDGSYAFDCVPVRSWAFDVVSGHPNEANAFVPISLEQGADRVLDPVILATQFTQPVPSVATEVGLGAGVWLTVDQSQLTLGDVSGDLFAVAVPPEARLPVELDGEVLAMWYLEPFDVPVSPPAALRIQNSWGVASGDVTAWVGSYIDAAWLPLNDLVVTDEALTASLPLISTLVLIQAP